MQKKGTKTKYYIGMFMAMILWGIAWTTGKVAVEHSNIQVAAFWRYFIAFLGMLPVVLYMKKSFLVDKIAYFYMIIAGLLSALFSNLFFAGLAHGDAGYGGTMVTSLSPLLTYFLSIMIFSTKVSFKQMIALSVGIFGAMTLLRVPMDGLDFLNVNSLYFLVCALVWSFVTIITQKVSHRVDPMVYTLVVFFITAVTTMFVALPYEPFNLFAYDQIFWYNILFMGLLAGSFSMAVFFISASQIGAHNAGVFMFIVPIGAIVSSYFVYDEQIASSTIIGCFLSFIAVVLFNHRASKKVL